MYDDDSVLFTRYEHLVAVPMTKRVRSGGLCNDGAELSLE